jgi:DNA-binding GntR family transcriptional regulator
VSAPPSHQLVIDYITSSIESGVYLPGDKLPTIAQLAEKVRVSQTAVKTALLVLNKEGVVIGRQGKGTFVPERPAAN